MSVLDDIIDGAVEFVSTVMWLGVVIIFACLYFGLFAHPLLR